MRTWTIYEHISPSNKVYVGITSYKNVNQRWRKGNGYIKCVVFYRAIQKHGWDNIKHNIIATNLGEYTAKNMEKDLIAYYKSKNISYNITDGGDGTVGVPCRNEQKERVGNIWRGKKIPEDIRHKMSISHLGKSITKEHRENIRKSKLGNTCGNKAVIMLKDGIIIREFPSCVVAGKELGTHPNCISRCCRKENKTWHGYEFEYKTTDKD